MAELVTSSDRKTFKRPFILAFCVIVVLQTVVLLICAMQKVDFHIDEIYSYVISNSSDADRFSHVSWLQGQWVSGSDFDKVTTVQPGDQLDFAAAYNNTATDCHPPLYYWALHAVCSLVPGQFSKWTGIGLNIALFVICQVFILLVSRELIRNDWLSLCPSLLYGFSALCIGNVEYIRMYVLLAMLAMLYIYQSLRVIEKGVKPSTLIPCCITVFLGALTQYYFLFFVFWMALLYGIWLLAHKRIREALVYGFGHIIAVIGMLAVFPFAIAQATGTDTNNVGNEVAQSAFDFGLWKHQIGYLLRETLTNITYAPKVGKLAAAFALIIVAVSLIAVVKRNRTELHSSSLSNSEIAVEAQLTGWLFLAFVLTFLTVAKVGGNYVYVRYIYFIVPIVFICFVAVADMGSRQIALLVPVTLIVGVAFGLISGGYTALRGDDSYTFEKSGKILESASEYAYTPLVVTLANSPTTVLTSNYTLIRTFKDVYVDAVDSVLDSSVIQDALARNGKCVVFIPTASEWTDGLDVESALTRIGAATGCNTPQYLFDFYYGSYFLISK